MSTTATSSGLFPGLVCHSYSRLCWICQKLTFVSTRAGFYQHDALPVTQHGESHSATEYFQWPWQEHGVHCQQQSDIVVSGVSARREDVFVQNVLRWLTSVTWCTTSMQSVTIKPHLRDTTSLKPVELPVKQLVACLFTRCSWLFIQLNRCFLNRLNNQ